MTKLSSMFPSRYVKSEDVDHPIALVIRDVVLENVAPDGAPAEEKPVVYFTGARKGLVLNRTNAGVLAELFGDEIEGILGRVIELYVDTSVMFRGERVSGLRLRAAAEPADPPPAARPIADPGDDDEGSPF